MHRGADPHLPVAGGTCSLEELGSQVSTAAPARAPWIEPMPPNTTYATMRIDLLQREARVEVADLGGEEEPADPDVEAPIAKASSLAFIVFTPLACAATSSSLTAAQARPSREPSSR